MPAHRARRGPHIVQSEGAEEHLLTSNEEQCLRINDFTMPTEEMPSFLKIQYNTCESVTCGTQCYIHSNRNFTPPFRLASECYFTRNDRHVPSV